MNIRYLIESVIAAVIQLIVIVLALALVVGIILLPVYLSTTFGVWWGLLPLGIYCLVPLAAFNYRFYEREGL